MSVPLTDMLVNTFSLSSCVFQFIAFENYHEIKSAEVTLLESYMLKLENKTEKKMP